MKTNSEMKAVSTKSATSLMVAAPFSFNLRLKKAGNLAQVLSETALFRQPKTGDAEFDQLFSIAAYRDDVVSVLRQDAALRASLKQLAKETPKFLSLTFDHGKLSLSMSPGVFSQLEAEKTAREIFRNAAPMLIQAFANLPADNARQSRAKLIDDALPYLPFLSVMAILVTGVVTNQSVSCDSIRWQIVLLGIFLFATFHAGLVLRFIESGAARMQGMAILLFVTLWSSVAAFPLFVRGMNAHFDTSSAQIYRAEVIDKHISTGKGKTPYLRLSAWGPRGNSGNVAVSRSLYESANIGSEVCLSLREGAFDMPWYSVSACTPEVQ
jgi:hypothetical protein